MMLIRILVAVVVLYVLAAAFLFVYQRSFIYFPRAAHMPLADIGLPGAAEEKIVTADGVEIMAWYAPAPAGAPTIVLFHGNGGFIAAFADRIRDGQEKGRGVMLVEYRGYSGLTGTPTEEGLYADGRAALDWLGKRGVPSTSIFLYGESLGSGIATKLASERRVAGVILESPYTSAPAVGQSAYWMFPVSWLMWDRYDSLSRIKDIHAPLLIMHGGADQVIPQSQGRELFEAALEPKIAFFPETAHHVDLDRYGGTEEVDAFIAKFWKR